MSRRLSVLLNCSVLMLIGCSNKTEPPRESKPVELKRVTLHVKDMAERLDLA